MDRGEVQPAPDGPAKSNDTVQFLAGGTALTGNSGRLRVWNTAAGRVPGR